METFSTDIRAILQELNQSECQADELISGFKKGFDDVIQRYVLSKCTPAKPSKKKAKGRIEKLDSHDDSFSSTNSSRSTSTVTQAAPQNDAQSNDDEPAMMRPVRTGRANATTSYKEPSLRGKMRRDGTMTVVNVKVERTSKDGRTEKPRHTTASATANTAENESARPVRIKKEKNDEPLPTKSNASELTKSSSSSETTNGSKKNGTDDLNDSLEIVPLETSPTIELSDDESANGNDVTKMPPPSFVPPAKSVKEKKAPAEKKVRATRSKQSKRKIKQEPVSENEDECEPCPSKAIVDETNSEKTTQAKSTKSNKSAMEKSKANRALNTSGESLYEDAVSQTINNMTNKPQLSQQSDATFVTTADDTDMDTLSPRGTYVIPKNVPTSEPSNATFNVDNQANSTNRAVIDQTVVLKSKPKPMQKTKDSGGSIMTEDDSDSDNGTRKTNSTKSKKDPKELFNPLASKPIKQRVEAFEKLQTPQKETRTRTRVMTADSERSKGGHGSLFLKGTTSSEQTGKHIRATSASRYAQSVQKPTLSKSQSVEEIRKKAQAVVDEKKKKQDDKVRKAQQLREAQEKEKAEKQRKLLQEKEQRAKEKAQQKQQEELLRVQEQKRKEAEREQKRKEAMIAKKAAADRKEQEHYLRVLAEKKAMQEQLKLNKMKAEEVRKKIAYNFDMLESGDSTDDEGKTSSKRPTPPEWSMSHKRHAVVMAQARISTKISDKFFSVQPHEVDLREIFPRIDEKYLRRNSSAVWRSPPRYSQLPKY